MATFGLCDEALPSQNRPRVLNPGPSLLLPARPQLCRGGGRENPKAKSHPHPAPDPQSDSQQATSPLCASASTCGNPRIGPVGLSEDFANLLVQEDLCGKWRVPPELPTSLLPPAWAPPPFPGPALATSAPRFGQKDLAPPRASSPHRPVPACPRACLFAVTWSILSQVREREVAGMVKNERFEARLPGSESCCAAFVLCRLRGLDLFSLIQFSYLQNEDRDRAYLAKLLQGFNELIVCLKPRLRRKKHSLNFNWFYYPNPERERCITVFLQRGGSLQRG